MFSFSNILTDLQAVIAVHAARNRALTVLLVALWGRIGRMKTRLARLARLVGLWRAGMLPAPRVRGPVPGTASARPSQNFPASRAWLTQKLGYEVAAFGSQLRHLLTEEECAAFLAAVPQARRILRPLLRMLSGDPLPEVIVPAKRVVVAVTPVADLVEGIVVGPGSQILRV